MTIAEIKASTRPFLWAKEVAEILNCDPQAIRIMARTNPEALGFPVTVLGKRTKIPRVSFLAYIGE